MCVSNERLDCCVPTPDRIAFVTAIPLMLFTKERTRCTARLLLLLYRKVLSLFAEREVQLPLFTVRCVLREICIFVLPLAVVQLRLSYTFFSQQILMI